MPAPTKPGIPGAPDPVAELVRTYRELERDISARLNAAAARGATGSARFLAAQAAAIRKALERAETASSRWGRRNLPEQYDAGSAAALKTITDAGLPVIEPGFTGIDGRALRALTNRLHSSLADVRGALATGLVVGEQRVAARAIRDVIEGRSDLVKLRPDGTLSVVVPSGKFWDPAVYARMLGRTVIADARRVSFRSRYLQNGIDVVVVMATGSVHEECAVWEGEQLSLTGRTAGLPTVEDAIAAGLFHPNCTHRYTVDEEAAKTAPIPERGLEVPPPEIPFTTLGRGVPPRFALPPRVGRPQVPASRTPAPSSALALSPRTPAPSRTI